MNRPYAALTTRTNYAFLEGASHPHELVEQANTLGISALGITDRDGLYGIVRAWVAAKEHPVKLIYGSEITLDDDSTITLLASNRAGYANLSQLISIGQLRFDKGKSAVSMQEVCEHAEGVIALWGGTQGALVEPLAPRRLFGQLLEAFGDRLYALLWRHLATDEHAREAHLLKHAAAFDVPIVAATEVLYHLPRRRSLQDILTCIKHGVTLGNARALLRPNGEHSLLSPTQFHDRFSDMPDSVFRTLEVAERCDFDLADIRYRYPSERLPNGETSSSWLRELTMNGASERYPAGIPAKVHTQLVRELSVIDQLDYGGYFLTMWEIVRFCREENILCQGRGSAANSAVCFCLGITAVDPVRMDLLFERFLSVERAEPPDIDLDIQHGRREEVIQHVYDKYGRTHAAMVANVIRYRGRSAVREVGKVFDLPLATLERMSKLMGYFGGLSEETVTQVGCDPSLPVFKKLLHFASEIQEFPRHMGIHPGGFLLGHAPVPTLVPIENATMEARTVIQWDKYDVEALGLFKVDLLGLGALTHLDLCFKMLQAQYGRELNMATIPIGDPATYDLLCAADTVGLFQVESRAQMSMLPRLRPRQFYDLVIEISIVRPGPITGDMVHPYLRRRNGEELITYAHPCLEPVLAKTLGVPLFQEQVMKLAVVAADYSPGEADQLRRDMAAWRSKGKLEAHRERLIARMEAKGIATEFAERVFNQIKGFGEYGFPESHAASFALITYATAWMRSHYPATFTCGLLNAQPMGFYSPATIVDDAKRHGVVVLPVSIAESHWDCTLTPWWTEGVETHAMQTAGMETDGVETAGIGTGASMPPNATEANGGGGRRQGAYGRQRQPPSYMTPEPLALRMGARFLKGLRQADWESVTTARKAQRFTSIDDLIHRAPLPRSVLDNLAEAGALSCFGVDRRQALWQTQGAPKRRRAAVVQPELRLENEEETQPFGVLDGFQEVAWDYRAMNHSTLGHPLGTMRGELTRRGIPSAANVNAMSDGIRTDYVGMVICRQRPMTAKGVTFMTLEDESGFVNLVIWEKIFNKHRVLAKTTPVLGVTGRVQAGDGVTHLVADTLWPVTLSRSVRGRGSRDFR